MMTFNEFKHEWENMEIRENGYLNLGIDHPLELHIGYRSIDSKSLVLLNTGIVKDIPSSYAIRAAYIKLQNGLYGLEFLLLQNFYNDTFLRLCWDMIEYSRASKEPFKDFINRYLSWQKLLQYSKKEVLSYQEQKGLIGELLFLKSLLGEDNYQSIISAWTGPEGSDQDFQFYDSWTEVKAVSASAETVSISSLQQLDNPKIGTLEVYFLEKVPDRHDNIDLYGLAEQIRDVLKNNLLLLDKFNIKLFKYGFRDEEREEYEKNPFRLVEHRTYDVNDQFPKIIRTNVMVGIQECTYSLSIEYLDKFRKR